MNVKESYLSFISLLRQAPQALAVVRGSAKYPDIRGDVRFYQLREMVLVVAEVAGLPLPVKPCSSPVFGFHIHEGEECSGNSEDSFANAKMHYNPQGCPHPYHVGDLPPLFGNQGYAFSAFVTDRFTVREIVEKTIIIHSRPDDFKTQPSGDSGEKMACGKIIYGR